MDQERGKGARVQQRARPPAGVLHDSGSGQADAGRDPVRARRSPGRYDTQREARALTRPAARAADRAT